LSKNNSPIVIGKILLTDFINRFINCLSVGWWVGFGCGCAKLNVLQKRWLAALLIFAKRWHFVVRFSVRLLSFVSSVTLAPNVPRPCAVADYGKLICPAKIKINAKRNAEF
jgi:hypothetical protein